jgi:S-adenosylmethionine uptake transporter
MEKINKSNLYGILWILVNNLAMVIQTALIKNLSQSMHKFQVLVLYKVTVFLFVLPLVFYKGFGLIKTKKLHLHFLRAFLSITAAMVYVTALQHMPITTAMAVGFTEPLFVSLLAVVILKEYINIHVIIAAVIGFCGILIVTNPGSDTFNIYSLVVVAAAVIWAFDMIVIKLLGKTENPIQYLFYISLFSTLLGLSQTYLHSYFTNSPLPEWSSIDIKHVPKILALAGLYFTHLLAVFKAFQHANLSVLAPFDFSRIVFSTILDVALFNIAVNVETIVGALVIVSSSVYIVWKKEEYKQQNIDKKNLKASQQNAIT